MPDVNTAIKMSETNCDIIYEMIEKLDTKDMAEYYAIRADLETVKFYVYKEGFRATFEGKNDSAFTIFAKDNDGELKVTKNYEGTLHRLYTAECTISQFETVRIAIEEKEQEEMWEEFEDDSLPEIGKEVHGWFLDRTGERFYC